MDARGNIVIPLREDEFAPIGRAIRDGKVEAVAVCLLHSYTNDAHERVVERALRKLCPTVSVSISSRIAPEAGEYERMSTVSANA